MNLTGTLSKLALGMGVLLTVVAVGFWGSYWLLVSTPQALGDALFWTFCACVFYGIGMGAERYGGD